MLQPADIKALNSLMAHEKAARNLVHCIGRKHMQPARKKYYRQALVVVLKRMKPMLPDDSLTIHVDRKIAELERVLHG